MIVQDLNEIIERNRVVGILKMLKNEEKKHKFYIIKIGKTEIRTTSSHRMNEYIKLYKSSNVKLIDMVNN